MMPMDIPVPRRQRMKTPNFTWKLPFNPVFGPSRKRGIWGYFSLHPSFIQPYAVSFLLTRPFPSIQMVEKQEKIQLSICLSPLIKALLPDLLDWLDAWYPWSRQLDYRGLLQSCSKAAWGSQSTMQSWSCSLSSTKRRHEYKNCYLYLKITRARMTSIFCNFL